MLVSVRSRGDSLEGDSRASIELRRSGQAGVSLRQQTESEMSQDMDGYTAGGFWRTVLDGQSGTFKFVDEVGGVPWRHLVVAGEC